MAKIKGANYEVTDEGTESLNYFLKKYFNQEDEFLYDEENEQLIRWMCGVFFEDTPPENLLGEPTIKLSVVANVTACMLAAMDKQARKDYLHKIESKHIRAYIKDRIKEIKS